MNQQLLQALAQESPGIAQLLANILQAQGEPASDGSESSDDHPPMIKPSEKPPHFYLGEAQTQSRRDWLDAGTVLSIPLVARPGLVCYPRQKIPLRLCDRETTAAVSQAKETHHLGVVCSSPGAFAATQHLLPASSHCSPLNRQLSCIGTTSEVCELATRGDGEESVVVQGRQRFVLLNAWQVDSLLMGTVRILDDGPTRMPSVYARRGLYHRRRRRQADGGSGLERLLKGSHVQPLAVALPAVSVSAISGYVWMAHDPQLLAQRVSDMLTTQGLGGLHAGAGLPSDPTHLSFWLAQQLPLGDMARLRLLALPSTVERLQSLQTLLTDRADALCCGMCGIAVARRRDCLPMSSEGSMGAFANPSGWVHETFTVSKARHLVLIGERSTESSWFEGYAWTIVECSRCGWHIGWRFDAVDRASSLKKFYGLRRAALGGDGSVPRGDFE